GESREEADDKARALAARLEKDTQPPRGIRLVDDPEQERTLWEVREGGLGATAFPPDGVDHWPGWEDSAVPPERVGAYLRDPQALYDEHGLRGALYGYLGDGCIHSRISFDLRTAEGLRTNRTFLDAARGMAQCDSVS